MRAAQQSSFNTVHCKWNASLMAQMVKSLLAMQETPIHSLGQEHSLEEEMTTHSSILAWEIPWTDEPHELVHEVAESDRSKQLNTKLANVTRDMKRDIWANFMPNIFKLYIYIKIKCLYIGASLVVQTVKNVLAMQETQVWSPSQEDLLEEEMATHSSILARRIPWTEQPTGLQSMGSQSQTWLSDILTLHITVNQIEEKESPLSAPMEQYKLDITS